MSRLFIVAGPSGVGKSYLIEQLLRRYPGSFASPKLFTTRPVRPNEQAVDREFISAQRFAAMRAQDAFAFAEEFSGHWYGYTQAALEPTTSHHIINITPAMLVHFKANEAVVVIGMTVRPSDMALLERRMIARGDTPATVVQRLETIKTDMDDLVTDSEYVASAGRLFYVHNDSTVESIIKWLATTYLRKEQT